MACEFTISDTASRKRAVDTYNERASDQAGHSEALRNDIQPQVPGGRGVPPVHDQKTRHDRHQDGDESQRVQLAGATHDPEISDELRSTSIY